MPRLNREILRTDRIYGWHVDINDERIVLATWPQQGDAPDHAECGSGAQCEGCGNPDSDLTWYYTYFKCPTCSTTYRINAGGFRFEEPAKP